jgi:hypothetical protein
METDVPKEPDQDEGERFVTGQSWTKAERQALFSERFAPLQVIPQRDLKDVLDENKGER